jgi:hypothetical protein
MKFRKNAEDVSNAQNKIQLFPILLINFSRQIKGIRSFSGYRTDMMEETIFRYEAFAKHEPTQSYFSSK